MNNNKIQDDDYRRIFGGMPEASLPESGTAAMWFRFIGKLIAGGIILITSWYVVYGAYLLIAWMVRGE